MLVKVIEGSYGLANTTLKKDVVYSVFREDEEHYYVRNNDGMIEGFNKNSFTKISKVQEREFKLNRILKENKSKKESKELFDFDIDNVKITVEWTGSYPNLCSGEWIIRIDQMHLPIPENWVGSDMGTRGEYSRWYFNDGGEETEYYYNDDNSEWKKEDNWLNYSLKCLAEFYNLKFVGNMKKFKQRIYDEISDKDWRSGSCGGCI